MPALAPPCMQVSHSPSGSLSVVGSSCLICYTPEQPGAADTPERSITSSATGRFLCTSPLYAPGSTAPLRREGSLLTHAFRRQPETNRHPSARPSPRCSASSPPTPTPPPSHTSPPQHLSPVRTLPARRAPHRRGPFPLQLDPRLTSAPSKVASRTGRRREALRIETLRRGGAHPARQGAQDFASGSRWRCPGLEITASDISCPCSVLLCLCR
ncbi:hypothetical protein B0T16DRAFT_406120 [Cercophora newfieldiana]|uniref:Uncharacterized protein n=1 Tax=Cercophora newfieldiana TaxID=92897 RepID=A0AA40CUX6_9PEZI|nr:hypothetical protein B0T16DRAFT_406120 [Cercophora newfieldiana]